MPKVVRAKTPRKNSCASTCHEMQTGSAYVKFSAASHEDFGNEAKSRFSCLAENGMMEIPIVFQARRNNGVRVSVRNEFAHKFD